MKVKIITPAEDYYYNGMYTKLGIIEVEQSIEHVAVDEIGHVVSVLEPKDQVCFKADNEMFGFKSASNRLGFTELHIGFSPIMPGVKTKLLDRPYFKKHADRVENVRLRAITEISKMKDVASFIVFSTSFNIRHHDDDLYIVEHLISVEQVYTVKSGYTIHRLTEEPARDAVAHHDLYGVAVDASMAMFMKLDERVLTLSAVDRMVVKKRCDS